MEWPEELLSIFEDPLLKDVHPKPKAPTSADRMADKLEEISAWVEAHGGKLPSKDGSLEEKMLYRRLASLKEESGEDIKKYDRLHLLD